jgi:hypothetical protein
MGIVVIALFRPKAGMEEALLGCMRDHQPILRREGLVTDRPPYVMRARDGTLLEVFVWRSQEAIDAAHASLRVADLWRRYAACCDYVTLADLAEAREMFPGFAPVEP